MPRGQALGITFQLPEQDKGEMLRTVFVRTELLMADSYTRREYTAMIDVALGGRAAEEMIYGKDDTTSGCSSDLMRATDVATRMIRVSRSTRNFTALTLELRIQRKGRTRRARRRGVGVLIGQEEG